LDANLIDGVGERRTGVGYERQRVVAPDGGPSPLSGQGTSSGWELPS
jgi:hypothetical protein